MSRMARISSAAVGMVLLAALATYQGGHVDYGEGDTDALAGTAIAAPRESGPGPDQPSPCDGFAQDSDTREPGDGGTTGLNSSDCDAIASAER